MKEKKDCKIVQDLLPNYIENLTNEETNKFIDEHLKECNECQKIFENMKKDFKVNTTKRDEREVKYIKKYSKKMKLLKTILLFIVVIYVVVITRRTIIMTSLSGKVNENAKYILYSENSKEDKKEKILENQKIIRTPIVRNGKQATVGYEPDVWKDWK